MNEHGDTASGCPFSPLSDQPPDGSPEPSRGPARRSFLRGALGAGVAGAAVGAVGGAAAGHASTAAGSATDARQALAASTQAGRLPPVPFHGQHQAGILPSSQLQTIMLSFDVTASGRAELTEVLQTLTDRARFLTAGGVPPPVGISSPPSDSGVLGRRWYPTA